MNKLIKLFCVLFIFSLSNQNTSAQTMGKAGGNLLNFFDTNATGGQIGHSQAGSFGNFVFNSRWIAIGQPSLPSGQELYGMRIQDREYVGTFNYTGAPGSKDLEIVYGTVPVLSVSDPPSFASLPDLEFRTAANNAFTTTLRMKLTAGGTLAINSTYGGSFYKLYLSGRAFSTLGWFTPSDERYKKEVNAIANASEKLAQLKGVTYGFKGGVINGIDFQKMGSTKQQLGFIAQDLAKVFPELVVQDEQGYYAVNYQGLIPVLVEGFNEQEKVINEQSELLLEQESTISALNTKVDKLEKQMQALLDAVNALDNSASLELSPKQSTNAFGAIEQNNPNPFRGITNISYTLPAKANQAELVVFSLEGKRVATYQLSGRSGNVDFDGSNLPAGTYVYSLLVDNKQVAQKKMLVQ